MKKKIILYALTVILLLSFSCAYAAPEKETNQVNIEEEENTLAAKSPHVILLDMKTGSVIYQKNASEKVYPAALTNIMTALLVLENCNLEELVPASDTALSNVAEGDSKMGIIKGERLSVRQLLYGMMLSSASDAANLLAEKTSGSIEGFVTLMNERAKELGMKNTSFTNPTGDHDERHYTTAEDMAILVRVAMQNETFAQIVKTKSYSIPATEKCHTARKITNRNHFVSDLLRRDYYYKFSTGIKTGYSIEAKSCIAASAEKNSMTLLALVFKAETVDNVAQSFRDCADMFDYVFDNYVSETIVKKDAIVAQTDLENTRREKKLILKAEEKVTFIKTKETKKSEVTYKDTVPKRISAPVKENDIIGTREYFVNGKSIGSVNLLAKKSYKLDPITYIVNKMIAFVTSPWLFVTIAFVIFILIMAERRRRRILRKKRREARKKRNQQLIESIYED
ncbi:MAG: D-alanyl-D-alanine carboxypeptidase [Clostridia bacterium]|nr:D-alanyl-D-alanine carboxypeptidase [Clostridia bacterium]